MLEKSTMTSLALDKCKT